jgi:predicted 2-oxoglutarate/Fe(II)-dependent dioxygenase YbiX
MYSDKNLQEFINIQHGLFSEDLCDEIIETLETDYGDSWVRSGVNHPKINPEKYNEVDYVSSDVVVEDVRTSEEIWLSNLPLSQKIKSMDNKIFEQITHGAHKYVDQYLHLQFTYDEGYSILKYSEGCVFKEHIDELYANDNKGTELEGINRKVSCSVQLNDDFEDGGLSFFNNSVKIEQKKGTGIFFPSNWMYPHQALPVTKGTRYALVTWLR